MELVILSCLATSPRSLPRHRVANNWNVSRRPIPVESRAGAVVTGCSAAGLGVILALAERGAVPIVAADASPMRRRVAVELGAHSVVDMGTGQDPTDHWRTLSSDGQELFVFDASGTPDLLENLLRSGREFTFVAVVSAVVADTPDWTRNPVFALEFADPQQSNYRVDRQVTLDHLVAGSIDGTRLVTAITGLDGAGEAFELFNIDRPGHIKILVQPQLVESSIRNPADG